MVQTLKCQLFADFCKYEYKFINVRTKYKKMFTIKCRHIILVSDAKYRIPLASVVIGLN